MATYAWKCTNCSELVEVQRPMSDYQIPPDASCQCGSRDYSRFIGPVHFELKGGGWERTDYTKYGPDYNKQKQHYIEKMSKKK